MGIMKFVGINGNIDCYHPNQVSTCTVGEFIDYLRDYDEDMPLYLVNDNGYTYGSLSSYDISEHEIDDDGDLDDDIDYDELEDEDEDEDDVEFYNMESLSERYMDSETYYIDIDGIFGEHGAIYTYAELANYWDENKDDDPSLAEYSSKEQWLRDTLSWMEKVEGWELNESRKPRKNRLYIKDHKNRKNNKRRKY